MGKLYVVATPIGNLSDITERALDTLRSADLVAAEDTRRTLPLLRHFSIGTPLVSYHKFNEREKSIELIEKILGEDISVALVSDAGTPSISDPGCIIVAAARERGIEVTAIPGASAVTAALSVCGFIFDKFTFMGFIPRQKPEKERYYNILFASVVEIFVIYEAGNRITQSLGELAAAFPEAEVFLINDITKYYERAYRGKIADVATELRAQPNARLGEYTLVLKKNHIPAPPDNSEDISAEARLVDEMVRQGITLKEAIAAVCDKDKKLSKNEVYRASLKLKELL